MQIHVLQAVVTVARLMLVQEIVELSAPRIVAPPHATLTDVQVAPTHVKVVELNAPRIVAPPRVKLTDVQVAVQGHVRVRVQELLVKELLVRQDVMEAIAPPRVKLTDVQVAVQGHVRVRVQELLVKELLVRQDVMEATLILPHLQQN